jgi:uncharacterized protein with ACT and thioredoxin-like domain
MLFGNNPNNNLDKHFDILFKLSPLMEKKSVNIVSLNDSILDEGHNRLEKLYADEKKALDALVKRIENLDDIENINKEDMMKKISAFSFEGRLLISAMRLRLDELARGEK